MKASFLPKNRFRYLHTKKVFLVVGIFLVSTLFFSFFNSSVISVSASVWKAGGIFSRSFQSWAGYVSNQGKLIEENASLRERVSSLELENISLALRLASIDETLKLLGRSSDSRAVLASVLTHPPQSLYDIIVIDAGAKENLSVGQSVSLPEGPLLGLVSEVFQNSAKVKLFSSSGEVTDAILERNNLPVTLEGRGGGNFKILLPRAVEVERGDKIYSTSVYSELLATVDDVSVKPTDAFKEIMAISPINIFSFRFVLVKP